MRDGLPVETRTTRAVESALERVLLSYAYEEVMLPLLEFTELFSRGVGEATDIVEKEMYSLEDRDGDSITLRPEGTAGCVRALQQHGLLFNQTQRVFYRGPMFRYERPQKGRYRQFYQLGAEAFGMQGPDIDAELLALCASFWKTLGLQAHVRLELNSLGSAESRVRYRQALVDYLTPHHASLDPDSRRRLQTNPLRILDSKVAGTRELLQDAPQMCDYPDEASRRHFAGLCGLLDDMGIAYALNNRLVRGLDYYTHTVFEWVTDELGAQGTVCAGGRYDGLVHRLGGKATPAAGFALGLDRVVLLSEQVFEEHGGNRSAAAGVDVYCCVMDPNLFGWAQNTLATLREALPGFRIRAHAGGGKLKNQLKRADQSGAAWALIVGEDEAAGNRLTVKSLRTGAAQRTLTVDALIEVLKDGGTGVRLPD
jgi:histidyl-tRNA synthetase